MNADERWKSQLARIEQLLADPKHHDEAVDLATQALIDALRDFGEDDPRTLAILNTLGRSQKAAGRFDEALATFTHCLEQLERRDRGRTMDAAVVWSNVAGLHRARQEWDTAKEHYERALELKRALLGDIHPAVASSLCDLGFVEEQRGRLEHALTRYLEGYEVFRAAGRVPKPCLMAVINTARALQAGDSYDAALGGYMKVRADLRPPGVDPFIFQCLLALGRHDELLPYLLTTLEMPENRDNANLWRILGMLRLHVDADVPAAVQAWTRSLSSPGFATRYPDIAAFVSSFQAMLASNHPFSSRIAYLDLETGQFVISLVPD